MKPSFLMKARISLSKTEKIKNHFFILFLFLSHLLFSQSKRDASSCGLFAIAFTVEVLHSESPMDANFHVAAMRVHLMDCLERGVLTRFPQDNTFGARKIKRKFCAI